MRPHAPARPPTVASAVKSPARDRVDAAHGRVAAVAVDAHPRFAAEVGALPRLGTRQERVTHVAGCGRRHGSTHPPGRSGNECSGNDEEQGGEADGSHRDVGGRGEARKAAVVGLPVESSRSTGRLCFKACGVGVAFLLWSGTWQDVVGQLPTLALYTRGAATAARQRPPTTRAKTPSVPVPLTKWALPRPLLRLEPCEEGLRRGGGYVWLRTLLRQPVCDGFGGLTRRSGSVGSLSTPRAQWCA